MTTTENLLPYVLADIAILISVIAMSRRNGRAARDVADAARDVAESSAVLVDSMQRRIDVLERQVESTGEVPVSQARVPQLYAVATEISKHFNIEEIDLLAASMDLSDRVTGTLIHARALSLVVAAKNRYLFWHLIERLKQERPNVNWPTN